MGAGKGNQNAKKVITADAHLNMRVLRKHKEKWVKQANKKGLTLSQWVIEKLNS